MNRSLEQHIRDDRLEEEADETYPKVGAYPDNGILGDKTLSKSEQSRSNEPRSRLMVSRSLCETNHGKTGQPSQTRASLIIGKELIGVLANVHTSQSKRSVSFVREPDLRSM